MSKNKKAERASAMKKLRKLRKRWTGHEGVDTPFGHLLLGPMENGRPNQAKKIAKKKSV
jgi:hypothetical protein